MKPRLKIIENEMRIQLTKEEFDFHYSIAMKKSKKYESLSGLSSPYGFNHTHSHLVGVIAEYASMILFEEIEKLLNTQFKIDNAFQDDTRDNECDLYVNNTRIEVKCVKYGAWLRYGPCVSSKQLSRIEEKADIILWAVYNEKQNHVTFKGFNYVDQIRPCVKKTLTGPEGKQVENYPVIDLMNSLETLQI